MTVNIIRPPTEFAYSEGGSRSDGPRWPVSPPVAAVAMCVGALVVGAAVATKPLLVAGVALLVVLGIVIWRRPHVAAYLVIGITPLVVGIDRGSVIPVLRPNEALSFFCMGLLLVKVACTWQTGQALPRFRPHPVELGLLLMAITSSIVPVVVMTLRGQTLEADDISYCIVMWKYLALYLLVRLTVRTEGQIRRCLEISLVSGVVVGCVAVLQSLDLLGVRAFLAHFYAPFGFTGALDLPRGSSTLSLPAATADLMIFNLAIVLGILVKQGRTPRLPWYVGAMVVFILGTLAAAEFSSALGLLIVLVAVAAVVRRMRLLLLLPFVGTFAIAVMWPVIAVRLQGFDSASGLPISWIGRWRNLETYFFPQLFSGTNPLLGVRPAARVPVSSQAFGYVWIESGYVWLLWGGGVFLLGAFVYFVVVASRATLAVARPTTTWRSVAALAAFAAIVEITVLMLFDPHLTYRGSSDLLYALLALTLCGAGPPAPTRGSTQPTRGSRGMTAHCREFR